MGYLGPVRQRFEVLAVPQAGVDDLDLWTVAPREAVPARATAPATVPAPEPMPTPYPEPMPEPVPTPGPTPGPNPPAQYLWAQEVAGQQSGEPSWLLRAARALR